jgi:3-(3-hydroxy-phenyl)propionate hydroxylase
MTTSPYYQPRTYAPAQFASMAAEDPALPVVVVGAGPVGMAVALGLARRGIPVTVLEAATQVSFGSRAICISRHSLEVADRLGFGEELSRLALPWEGGRSFHRDVEVLRFRMPNEAHAVRGPMVNVSQSELEQIMVDALLAHPLVTLHWGAPVAGCTQTGDVVDLEVDTAGGRRHLRADWVVAADGGRSRMRELSGLRLQGASYEGRYVIADIHWESDLPTERMVWFDPPSNPGSTVIMHRQPHDIWRIDYQLDPGEDADVETQEHRIRARIASHLQWLQNDRPWSLEWHGFYKAHALALDSFVHDRVVFAGDAAHLVPIFGVRGLNSGMEDAETLTWMLAAVVGGAADRALLDTYSRERHHAWEQNVANAGKSTLIMTPGSHGHRTTRDALLALATVRPEFSHLINPRQSSATSARPSPLTVAAAPGTAGLLPGDPVEDRRVRLADGKQTSLDQVRGPGLALFGFALDGAAIEATARLRDDLAGALPLEGVTLALVTDRACPSGAVQVLDDAGDLAAAWGARPGEVFVVRPDGLLLARGPVADLAGLPARLRAGRGRTAASPGEVVVPLSPEQSRREQAWLALSAAIDTAAPDDREGLLARLTLLLADQVDTDALLAAVATASATR